MCLYICMKGNWNREEVNEINMKKLFLEAVKIHSILIQSHHKHGHIKEENVFKENKQNEYSGVFHSVVLFKNNEFS